MTMFGDKEHPASLKRSDDPDSEDKETSAVVQQERPRVLLPRLTVDNSSGSSPLELTGHAASATGTDISFGVLYMSTFIDVQETGRKPEDD